MSLGFCSDFVKTDLPSRVNNSYEDENGAAQNLKMRCLFRVCMITPLLAIAPASFSWSPKVALVMIVCNVIAIGLGKATIKYPNEGAKLPNAAFFGGMGHAALLGTTSLGHIIGIGAIQGLAARGVL